MIVEIIEWEKQQKPIFKNNNKKEKLENVFCGENKQNEKAIDD